MKWGLPQLGLRIDIEDSPETYYVYETEEEALEFVSKIRSLNR